MAAESTSKPNSMSPNRGTNSEIKRSNELDDNDSSTKKAKYEHELQTNSTNGRASGSNDLSEKIEKSEDKYFAIEADAAEDKGSRHTMEDAWVVLHDASLESPGNLRCAHFAIYDGHGGRLAAEFAQKYLHRKVLSAGLPPGCQVCKEGYIRWFPRNRPGSPSGKFCSVMHSRRIAQSGWTTHGASQSVSSQIMLTEPET